MIQASYFYTIDTDRQVCQQSSLECENVSGSDKRLGLPNSKW